MNKKGDITFLTVIIIVSIVSFGVIASFFIQTNDIISSSKDDILCNAFLKLKGENIYNIVDFFYQLNVKCHVDDITIDSVNTEEIYKKFADTTISCYDRYGKGEYDFLENYKAEGNWCFLCAKVSFDDTINHQSDFFDFIKWTQVNTLPTNKSQTYYDYTNYVYFNPTYDESGELESLENDISLLISEVSTGEFSELLDVSLLTLEKYQTIVDYQLKNFDSSQEYYVTYKFDRIPNIDSRLEQAGDDAQSAIIGGLAASIGTEAVLGLVTFGVGTVKAILTAPLKIAKFAKINRIISRISKFKVFSKKTSTTSYLDETLNIVSSSGKTLKLAKKIQSFKATPADLKVFSALLNKEGNYLELSKKFDNLADIMTKGNIKNLDGFNTIAKNEKFIEDLKYLAQAEIPIAPGVNSAKLLNQINSVKQFALEDISKISVDKPISITSNIKNLIRISAFSTGAYLGLVYTDENPSNQYVDIMTKEEFYRQCGFPPSTTATN
jgi:hypothetical protein